MKRTLLIVAVLILAPAVFVIGINNSHARQKAEQENEQQTCVNLLTAVDTLYPDEPFGGLPLHIQYQIKTACKGQW